ncbi:MAG: filamentous hemagglutinin N-terminal domain-containing protein [Burkholderiales bacterium]|nr:filamentous hemagglutinin N-terminal domain-containing protein [Burkholderiales bacterium]
MLPRLSVLAVAACFSGAALANPSNPTVVHGTATFQQAGNILNITNSANAIINWGSFSISVGELTRFIQPSALSAVLNRVTGQDPSVILGALQSNGRVFLINPNGIVFGAGSQVDVAGLVASTLNLSNDDFLNNRMRFTDGAGAGSVLNQGQITGGSVYLVGNAVSNNGLITSPNGEVVLAAGNSVELVSPGTPNLRVEVVAAENEARNLGTISAEAGRIGIYAGLINNSGTLNASSAVAEGGRILLKAKKDITLTSTSVIDASGQGGGEIIAFADNNMYVDGVLNASAPVSGDGGFIETSGKNRVKVADSVVISTSAVNGKTGTWLIDPTDFVIAYGGGDISGGTLGGLLDLNNVVFASTNGASGYGGDILVNDGIYWSSDNSLTLTAINNVVVNEAISNGGGSGGLNLYAGWNGSGDPATPTLVPSVGDVIVNAPISVGSALKMAAGNDILIFNGVQVYGRGGGDGGGSASIMLTGRSVVIDDWVAAYGQPGYASGIAGGNANITIAAGTDGVTVYGGLSAQAAYGGSGGVGGNAGIQVTSAGNVNVYNLVEARAGGDYYVSANGGNASIQLTSSGGSINVIDGGEISARGGDGGLFNGGSALVKLNAAQGIQIDGSEGCCTSVEARGGSGDTGGSAVVELVNTGSSSAITVSNGAYVDARGGDGPEGGVGGSALTTFISSGGIVLNNSQSSAQGGHTYFYDGTGGAATFSMFAGGNVQIEGAEGVARGGEGAAGGSAAVLVVAGGNVNINNYYYYGLHSSGGNGVNGDGLASTVVSASGDVNLSNAYLSSGGVVGLGAGNNIVVDYGSGVYGSTGLSVSALGNLSVTNQSYMSGGSGNAFINTGGNVLVDQSEIYGSPDVFMQVGGVIDINGTLAYGGKISASSPSTININFTSTSGGFAVNGIAGLVYDPATNTGFFVNGVGASIGNGINIVYSGTPPDTLNIPTETLLVAMGASTKPPDPDKDKNVFDEVSEEKKKDAPVCR